MTTVSAKDVARGLAAAVAMFVVLGTVAAALLLEYFEPARLYVALGGAALLALAVWLKLARPECLKAQAGSTPASSPSSRRDSMSVTR